jgi:hypothetical protein
MCDRVSAFNFPCENGWFHCGRCRGTGRTQAHDYDSLNHQIGWHWRTCPQCYGRGKEACPGCNQAQVQADSKSRGGISWGFVALFVVGCLAVFGYQSMKTSDDSPKPPPPRHQEARPSDLRYQVNINGVEAIGHGPGSWITCSPKMYRTPRDATAIVVSNASSTKAPGIGGATATVTNADPPEVVDVDLNSYPNKQWTWNRGQTSGHAAVTKNGNTYQIVGSIAPASGGANPVPFEFDATCP